jgi:hypothetical protein
MVNCSNKSSDKATKYFSFKYENLTQFYPVCCLGCVKSIIKKVIIGKSIKTISEDQIKDLQKIPQKIVNDRHKQVLMEKRTITKKPKKNKSLKKKSY